jgi:hypothetical protein
MAEVFPLLHCQVDDARIMTTVTKSAASITAEEVLGLFRARRTTVDSSRGKCSSDKRNYDACSDAYFAYGKEVYQGHAHKSLPPLSRADRANLGRDKQIKTRRSSSGW